MKMKVTKGIKKNKVNNIIKKNSLNVEQKVWYQLDKFTKTTNK